MRIFILTLVFPPFSSFSVARMKGRYVLLILALFSLTQCATEQEVKKEPVAKISERQALAKILLYSPNVKLARNHVSGVQDGATSYHNMSQTAYGGAAKRSSYGKAPGGYVYLKTPMLRAMRQLVKEGYTFSVSSIAGASHSSTSRHYLGVAFDVNYINGRKVNWSNPYYRNFMNRCRQMGATEVLGPGDRGHSGHLHLAWPRATAN